MEYPPNLWKLQGVMNIPWLLYETRFPPHWIESLQSHGDVFISPSKYTARRAAESGISEERIYIVPFGVRIDQFRKASCDWTDVKLPFPSRADSLTFLFIGSQHRRKGMKELLSAYHASFTERDNVRLIVKTLPHASDREQQPWEYSGKKILKSEKNKNSPEVLWTEEHFTAGQMAKLYHISDLLVVPSYAESFGLIFLESMATETPVITTNYGAVTEFVNNENGWLVPAREEQCTNIAYDHEEPCPFGIPDTEKLGNLMRHVYEHPEQIDQKQYEALKTAEQYTWKNSAKKFQDVLDQILN